MDGILVGTKDGEAEGAVVGTIEGEAEGFKEG
jgi:hypothetical protein